MGTVWQRLFTISVSNRLPEKLVQGAVGGKKLPFAVQSEWFLEENRLLMLWIFGFLICFLFHTVQYLAWKKRIPLWDVKTENGSVRNAYERACERCGVEKNKIIICTIPGIPSPMLYGFRNTRILLPQEMTETLFYTEDEWILIFLHEITHWQKLDLWYKLFLQIVNDIFWFCIPMWWVRKMADIDLE